VVLTNLDSERRQLYRWQLDALISWLRCGRRGVIEAVTGSGKTDLAIAAASDALRRGHFVLVVVPSRVLMEQWHTALCTVLTDARIGRLGDSWRDTADTCDVLVATRHSAAAYKPIPPGTAGGLLIVDECHGLGGKTLRRALLAEYEERLGLTATLERSDDAVTDLLLPFFGGACYRYGFEQAIADGVCARPRVAFVGVPLSDGERAEYVAVEHRLVSARQHLRGVPDMPLEPFGDFLAAVAHLAEQDSGADGRAARDYLDAFSKRRQIVAQSTGKFSRVAPFSVRSCAKNAKKAKSAKNQFKIVFLALLAFLAFLAQSVKRGCRLHAGQPFPDRVFGQLRDAVDVQFFHQISAMGFGGLDTDVKLGCHFFGGAPFGNELEDFTLALGKHAEN